MFRVRRGFSLLEVAVAIAIVGMMALATVPVLSRQIERAALQAEEVRLTQLEADLRRSFFEGSGRRNLSWLAETLSGSDVGLATEFSRGDETVYVATENHWLSKLGRLQGMEPVLGSAITEEDQNGLYRIACNSYGRARWLLRGPSESGQQRYLLISLMAPASRGLKLPMPDGSVSWFDAVWSHPWESQGGSLPQTWYTQLSPEEIAAWMEGEGATGLTNRLLVRRIVQPKYRVTINNTHPSFSAWASVAGLAEPWTSLPSSGPISSSEILAGRQVVVRRGLGFPGLEAYRFILSEPTSVSIQP